MENTSSQDGSAFGLSQRGSLLLWWAEIPGADADSVERLESVQVRASVKSNARNTLSLPSTLWPREHSHILGLIYVTHHPVLLAGHVCYHHSIGKDAHKITGPGKELGRVPCPFDSYADALLYTTLPFL